MNDEYRRELELWWARNLQRAADTEERFGATLLTINGKEIPCLCLRTAEDDGTYMVIAPSLWGPLFVATGEDGVRSVRHDDGVIDFFVKRSIMSPLRKWLDKQEENVLGS